MWSKNLIVRFTEVLFQTIQGYSQTLFGVVDKVDENFKISIRCHNLSSTIIHCIVVQEIGELTSFIIASLNEIDQVLRLQLMENVPIYMNIFAKTMKDEVFSRRQLQVAFSMLPNDFFSISIRSEKKICQFGRKWFHDKLSYDYNWKLTRHAVGMRKRKPSYLSLKIIGARKHD